ncbi:MAG: CoA transferase [Conexibacter sp.]|nr:CoA transferase [Conexibacter sp.]
MSDKTDRPLAGVRVLAVEQFGAGPWSTLQLVDLGAEVIKIEDPASGGDVGRYVPPFQDGEDSLFFETFNRGKRSVSLDLRHDDGRTVLHDLVRESDALFCNLRGDQPARLGLTYEALREIHPGIVCCSLSGFGMTGPRRAEGAYDYVIQGLAGWMSLTGEPSGPPSKSGLSLVDFCGGYVAAIALLGGLARAERTGVGCQCDISLQETAIALLNYTGTWTLSTDYRAARRPESAHPSIVPFQLFRTADGWITVACAKEKFWTALCRCLERPDLHEDPRFVGFAQRDAHRDTLLPELRAAFAARPTAEWLQRLGEADVPCGPVNDVETALNDEQVLARGGSRSVDHPRLGEVRHVASPLHIDGPPGPAELAPQRGHDTAAVLSGLCGYSKDRIAELESRNVFGPVEEATAL